MADDGQEPRELEACYGLLCEKPRRVVTAILGKAGPAELRDGHSYREFFTEAKPLTGHHRGWLTLSAWVLEDCIYAGNLLQCGVWGAAAEDLGLGYTEKGRTLVLPANWELKQLYDVSELPAVVPEPQQPVLAAQPRPQQPAEQPVQPAPPASSAEADEPVSKRLKAQVHTGYSQSRSRVFPVAAGTLGTLPACADSRAFSE